MDKGRQMTWLINCAEFVVERTPRINEILTVNGRNQLHTSNIIIGEDAAHCYVHTHAGIMQQKCKSNHDINNVTCNWTFLGVTAWEIILIESDSQETIHS